MLTATCTGVLSFLTAECVDAAFFQASMATVSACCKWHIMLESYWCTAVLYPHQMCNKCFGPAAARVFITCAAGVKGKLE